MDQNRFSAQTPLLFEEYRRLARERGARHILDYGCGKRNLAAALGREFDVREFDPALPGLDASPAPADLVACIDVLEHVELDYLENVLANLVRVTLRATDSQGQNLPLVRRVLWVRLASMRLGIDVMKRLFVAVPAVRGVDNDT